MGTAGAAGLSGRWRADSTFPRGGRVTEYLELQVKGSALQGSFTDGFGGHHAIEDGKVNGVTLSFSMHWDQKGRCNVTGVATSDGGIELKLVTPAATRVVLAKREKAR